MACGLIEHGAQGALVVGDRPREQVHFVVVEDPREVVVLADVETDPHVNFFRSGHYCLP